MNLNLHIIFDELDSEKVKLIANDNLEPNIIGLRFLPVNEDVQLSESYLYITKFDNLKRFANDQLLLNIAIIGSIDENWIMQTSWNVLIFPDEMTVHDVFNEIQSIFEKYTNWEHNIFLAIARGDSSQVIFDLSAECLQNPIALHDNNGILLMKAGKFSGTTKNTIWETILNNEFSTINTYTPEEVNDFFKKMRSTEKPILYDHIQSLPNQTLLAARLEKEDITFAFLGATDINSPFTKGEVARVFLIKKIMEWYFTNNNLTQTLNEGIDSIAARILSGYSVDESVIIYRLERLNWKIDDWYQVLFFNWDGNSLKDQMFANRLIADINDCLANSITFSYEDGIIAIIQAKDNMDLKNQIDSSKLDKLQAKQKISCSKSVVFNDFTYIKNAYLQCKITLNLKAKNKNMTKGVYLFEDVFQSYVIETLQDKSELKSICEPRLLNLYQSSDSGREFVHSLKIFLINGKSLTAASKILCIHRNTLIYRIERIEEILGIEIKTIDENTFFYLYMSCLIAEYLNEN